MPLPYCPQERPFVMTVTDELNMDDEYEGFTIDLIKRLSDMLSFKYTIYMSPNNRYGAEITQNVWDGMVGEIMAGVSIGCVCKRHRV